MDRAEQFTQVANDLKAQVEFLDAQVMVYESTEPGRKRLREVIELVQQAASLLEELPAAKAPAAKAASAEAAVDVEDVEPPEDEDDLDGWLAYLLQHGDDEEASSHVERLFEAAKERSDWDQVVNVYLARVELADTPEDRVTLLEEVARIYEQEIGDLGKAFTAILAAYREDPANQHIADEATRLGSATEQWSEMVATLNDMAPGIEDKTLAAGVWLKLGRVYNDRIDRPDYAVAALWHALDSDPECTDAWDDLASIYKQKEQWTDLAHVLKKRLGAAEEKSDRIFFLLELADLHDSRLGDPNEARIFYEEVLGLDPNNMDALVSMEAVLRRLELWEPMVRILEKRAELAEDGAAARRAHAEAAELLWKQLEDPETASRHFEKLHDEDPENLEILASLYEIYEELDRQKDFLRIAEQRAELVEDEDLRIAIYRRMAVEMQADAKLVSQAADVLEKIIEVDPEGEQTYRDLETIYIKSEGWDELVTTYRRHADIAQSNPVKCEVLRAMAAVLDEKLSEPKAAIEALQEATEHDAEDLDSLVYLSTLLEGQERWVELVDVLSRRAELTTVESERVDLHRRIGEVSLNKLGEPEVAEKRLMKALELDPDNVGAMMALVELYKDREEWLRAANMMIDAEQATGNRLEKARMLFDAGELHRTHLDNTDKAVELYAKAMLVDPEHVQAAGVLAEHYYEKEQWEEAEPLLDLLVRKVDPKERKKVLVHQTRLGMVAKHLRKAEKAIKHLDVARDMDPTSLTVLRELADLKFHMEIWADVANLYQAILVAHRDAISSEELVQVYHRLGSVKMELGEKDKALNLFEKALEVDASFQPSVQAVIRLREESEDYDRIVATEEALLARTEDPAERHKLLVEIGDTYAEKLENPERAREFFEEALELKEDDRGSLHKLLEIHTANEHWDMAVDIVLKLGELAQRPVNKAKYIFTAGLIYRDELKENQLAVEYLEKSLDFDPSNKAAFEAVERILEEQQDWKELARCIRRQFKRLPDNTPGPVRVQFLDRLGELYSDKLGELDTAITAYEAASGLEPENAERRQLLAGLYLKGGPDMLDKAIEQHHAMLNQNPYKIQLYKDLTELYIRTQQKDKTWCLCAALTFLKKASEKERLFFDRYRQAEFVLAQRKVSETLWRDVLRHPAESARIDAIFAGVCQPVALLSAQPHKKFKLARNERLNPDEDNRAVFRMFVYASRVLDVNPRPEIFVRADQPQPVQVANAQEKGNLLPTWLVDPDKFAGKSEREIVFEITRQLAHMRPERYLWRALVSQSDLFNVLYAALSIMAPHAPVPHDSPDVKKMSAHLKKTVPPLVFEQLLPVARDLLAAGEDETNLSNWILATQRTALRTAMVLTNDFQAVAKVVATEPDSLSGIGAKDRLADLLLFSVSPEYFDLRKHLGFSIG